MSLAAPTTRSVELNFSSCRARRASFHHHPFRIKSNSCRMVRSRSVHRHWPREWNAQPVGHGRRALLREGGAGTPGAHYRHANVPRRYLLHHLVEGQERKGESIVLMRPSALAHVGIQSIAGVFRIRADLWTSSDLVGWTRQELARRRGLLDSDQDLHWRATTKLGRYPSRQALRSVRRRAGGYGRDDYRRPTRSL